jgi:ABC-2 type transport system ATP-binding protein
VGISRLIRNYIGCGEDRMDAIKKMIKYNTILEDRIVEIRSLISVSDMERATDRLIDFAKDFGDNSDEDAALIQKKRYSELKHTNLLGALKYEDYAIEGVKITKSVLEFSEIVYKKYIDKYKNSYHNSSINFENENENQQYIPKLLFHASNIVKDFKDFSLCVNELKLYSGQVTAIIGENGSGKSTLIKIVSGELEHDSGELSYFGMGEGWYEIKRSISYVSQNLPHWIVPTTAILEFDAIIHAEKNKNPKKEVEKIIYRLGLEQQTGKSWSELSGGNKVRFQLAKSLIKKPMLLILDEPLAQLDIVSITTFLNTIKDFAKSHKFPLSVLISSHHINEVEKISDEVLFLSKGKVKYKGRITDFKYNSNIIEINCSESKEDIENILNSNKIEAEVFEFGSMLRVKFPDFIETKSIFKALIDNNISLISVTDISNSTKRFF